MKDNNMSQNNPQDPSRLFPPKKQPFDKKRSRILYKQAKKTKGDLEEGAERFHPDLLIGLTKPQIEQRFREGLYNITGKRYSKSLATIFIQNICTFFNLLCIVAMIALIFSGASITQYLFVVIFVSNIVIGIIQEIRAKMQIDRLSILSASTVKTKRYGALLEIPVGEVVLDDVLILETGNQVPADCILAEGIVEVNESLLTGESVSVKKSAGDPIYAGSFISSGKCVARAEKVGKSTYISSLTSQAKKYKKPNSEIMRSITTFIRVIGCLIVPIAIGMFFINWNNLSGDYTLSMSETWEMGTEARMLLNTAIQKTCAIIVGMIPSGMMLLTSMALAVGVVRLAKKNTLVQDLYSLEMLARVDVLCLDKTGTITDGRMKVNDCKLIKDEALPKDYIPYTLEEVMSSFLASLPDNNQTSIALFNHFGHSSTLRAEKILPFSSKRKYSAVTFENLGTFVLGAPEFIFSEMSSSLEKNIKDYAIRGLRALVVGYSPESLTEDKAPDGVIPYALISLQDNIRADAIESIRWFKENGVAIKVISGDNAMTVAEVARRAGVENASKYISLEGLTDTEVETVAKEYTVFGRVTPEQKQILIRTIKASGKTVAMTGDGVNDLLALKEADCAISVASGAEAARNVSHLVLMDNNFNSLPNVVFEGRRVINNIENSASLYLMKTLLITCLALFCLITQQSYFFTTDNMLMFELFISGLASFFLSLQPNSKKVEGKFFSYVISHSIPQALTMFLCVMAVYITYATPSLREAIYTGEMGKTEWQALMVIILNLSGIVMLYRICQPFNILRGSLFSAVTLICILILSIRYGDFALGNFIFEGYYLLTFNAAEVLLLSTITALAFPASKYLVIFCERLSKSFEAQTKESKLELFKKNVLKK